MSPLFDATHILAAVLASWRLTELITMDRISAPFRRRFPHYLWGCPRCVSVWAGIICTSTFYYAPWLNWPLAFAWLYLVRIDWVNAVRTFAPPRRARPIAGGSDLWAGVLDPARAINWELVGVIGGIPSASWTPCGASMPSSSTAAQINTRIAGCGSNQYVLLDAGTFNLSAGIVFNSKNNVALRGAGADQTKLIFTGGCNLYYPGLICIAGAQGDAWSGAPNTATWDSGYTILTTSIGITRLTGSHTPAVGEQIFIDQCNDGLTGNACTGTATVGADMAVCDQPIGLCSGDVPTDAGRQKRGAIQPQIITSVTGTGPWTLGITPGVRLPNVTSARTPGAFWYNSAPITNVGIENLSIDNSGVSTTSGGSIMMLHSHNCWVRGVRSLHTNNKHIKLHESTHVTVRDSYFYDAPGASESYGIDTYAGADNLAENNIFQHIANPLMTEDCLGCVFGYNYSFDDYYTPSAGDWQQAGAFYGHSVGNAFNLSEGNDGIGMTADAVHGSSNFGTSFRSYLNGRDTLGGSTPPGKTQQTNPIILNAHARYYNIIGNVMGGSYHTTYEYAPPSANDTTTCWHSIYALGWGGNCTSGGVANDTLVKNSLMRWGNCDSVTGLSTANCKFTNGEVPSGLSPYGNAVPSSHTLPASMYLSSYPTTWWGTPWGIPKWPVAGPDVIGGNIPNTGGLADKIPARLCYENAAADMDYSVDASGLRPIIFNATICYIGSSIPAGNPRMLSVIPFTT